MTKLALLLDRLYIAKEHVTDVHKEAFTETYSEVVYSRLDQLPRKCQNCDWWLKKWPSSQGQLTTCDKQGYTEEDICNEFEFKQVRQVIESRIESFRTKGSCYLFARGNLGKIGRVFHDFEIQDERVAPELGIDLKFLFTLRDYQEQAVKEWFEHGFGIIQAPTASGKSIIMCDIICKAGLKSLILTHENRHLKVIEERLYQSTNLRELEKESKTPLLGYFKKGQGNFPITLSTFQAFNSSLGKLRLQDYVNKFGLIWVDECHHTAAPSFHRLFSSFNSFYRGGCSATPTRKDKLHHAVYNSIGPVVTIIKREMMVCSISWVRTEIMIPQHMYRHPYPWVAMLNFLAGNTILNEMALELILKDLQAGRKVLVLTIRRAQAFWMQTQITAAGYNCELIIGGTVQDSFERINQDLVDEKLHCVIGSKVMNENVDIPILDCLHLLLPSANEEEEEQKVGRIRRPWPSYEENTKVTPIVRSYCFKGPLGEVGEKTRRKVYTRLGFIVPKTRAVKTSLAAELNTKKQQLSLPMLKDEDEKSQD